MRFLILHFPAVCNKLLPEGSSALYLVFWSALFSFNRFLNDTLILLETMYFHRLLIFRLFLFLHLCGSDPGKCNFIFSIWCRRLVSDLHTMLASHLEDTFCCFLDDGTHQLAASDASTQVPARLLSAACLPARPPARLPACLLAHPRACLLCLLCCGGPLDSCIAGWPAYRHFACLLIMGCPLLHAPCRLARSAWSRSCGGTWMAGRPRWRCACCRCWPRSWRQLATGGGCPGLSWPPHACARAGACPGGSLQAACQGSIST